MHAQEPYSGNIGNPPGSRTSHSARCIHQVDMIADGMSRMNSWFRADNFHMWGGRGGATSGRAGPELRNGNWDGMGPDVMVPKRNTVQAPSHKSDEVKHARNTRKKERQSGIEATETGVLLTGSDTEE